MCTIISIGMSVYNCEKTSQYRFSPSLNQTFEDWELIVIDDGSQDRTLSSCGTVS